MPNNQSQPKSTGSTNHSANTRLAFPILMPFTLQCKIRVLLQDLATASARQRPSRALQDTLTSDDLAIMD